MQGDGGSSCPQVAKNGSLGFNDTKTACYVTKPYQLAQDPQPATQPIGSPSGALCSDPDAHVFWDQYAPLLLVLHSSFSVKV